MTSDFFFSHLTLLWLFLSGIPIGIFAIVFGGTMFLSLPVFQILFPELAMGAIIGNIKMGSVIRNLGAVFVLRKDISLKGIWPLFTLFCGGAVLGAISIANVSQVFIPPAIIAAILISEFSKQISSHIPKPIFYLAVLLTGMFGGIIGAGISILILALLRIRIHEDHRIHHVRSLAIFTELLLTIAAVVVFWIQGQLIFSIWIAWAAGSIIGGFIGGKLIHYTGKLNPKTQKIALRAVFAFALIIALLKFR